MLPDFEVVGITDEAFGMDSDKQIFMMCQVRTIDKADLKGGGVLFVYHSGPPL